MTRGPMQLHRLKTGCKHLQPIMSALLYMQLFIHALLRVIFLFCDHQRLCLPNKTLSVSDGLCTRDLL